MQLNLIILKILIVIPIISATNILLMSNLASPSHHFWNKAIANELANRGHNITIISPFFETEPPQNVHYIHLANQTGNVRDVKLIMEATDNISPFAEAVLLQKSFYSFCSESIDTIGFRTLLNYPSDFPFGLILHDFVVGPCFLPFLHKFNYPPMIVISAYGHPSYLSNLIGSHDYYAYVPHTSLKTGDRMTFWQRFTNFMIHLQEYFLFKYNLIPQIDALVAEHFGPNVPSVGELEKRTALTLVNTHPVFDYSQPISENVIPVAGLHIKDPKPLPKDLKTFIDSSKSGVIIFSLGSNFRSDFLSKSNQNLFLEVFNSLSDYHFLWKFESNISSDLMVPPNVRIQSWLPVSDILADSKVKAIFFHGGLLTTHEALWRGVPMIIMPFGLDQRQNLIKAKRLGVAEGVNYLSLNRDEVRRTILKVLEDPLYVSNAHKISVKFRDQKEHPLERAIWWIEWLIRNPDGDNTKTPVFRLGYIVANAFDIIVFVAFIIAGIIVALIKLICLCTNMSVSQKRTYKNIDGKKQQ